MGGLGGGEEQERTIAELGSLGGSARLMEEEWGGGVAATLVGTAAAPLCGAAGVCRDVQKHTPVKGLSLGCRVKYGGGAHPLSTPTESLWGGDTPLSSSSSPTHCWC